MATAVVSLGRDHGGYWLASWAPLGMALAAGAAGLVVAGRRPPRATSGAAALLVLVGGWSAASIAWGGLPHEAWASLDRYLVAAAAIVLGAVLARSLGAGRAVAAGVLIGIVTQAAEALVRAGSGSFPAEWFAGRLFDGPVGYHNAQAGLYAVGVPLAVFWTIRSGSWAVRALGGSATGVLLAALLLTQSRGALVATAAALVVALALDRSAVTPVALVGTAAAGLGLVAALRDVDSQLLTGTPSDALERYAGFAGAAAAGLALVWVLVPLVVRSRRIGLVAAALLLAGAVAVGVNSRESLRVELASVSGFRSDGPPLTAPGRTRLPSLAANGRRDAWRVAWDMVSADPLTGAGQGRFAREWARERTLTDLYVLQPHSIELELLGELGVVGALGLLLFAGAAALGVSRSPDRGLGAGALGALAVVLFQASVDWTWSFTGIVVPALLVVGAASAMTERPPVPRAIRGLALAAGATAVVSLAGPYLGDRQVARAEGLERSDPNRARGHAQAALRVDPGLARASSLLGRLAEAEGDTAAAVEYFRRAAARSQRPWLEHYREARVLARAGLVPESREACRRAAGANPGEGALLTGACAYDVAGNTWPVTTVDRPSGGERVGVRIDSLLRDLDCDQCTVTLTEGRLTAAVAGGADTRDTAYGVHRIGKPADSVSVSFAVSIEAEAEPTRNLALVQLRDERNALLWEIYRAGGNGTIALWSPPGGLSRLQVNASTGVDLDLGERSLRIDVSMRPGEVTVRIDGQRTLSVTGLAGAMTGQPRYLRLGIVAYAGSTVAEPIRASYSRVEVVPVRATRGS